MRWPEIVATTTTAAAASSAAVAEATTAMIISSKYKLNTQTDRHTHTLLRRKKRRQQLLYDVLFQICMKKGTEEGLNFRNNRNTDDILKTKMWGEKKEHTHTHCTTKLNMLKLKKNTSSKT